MKNIDTLHKPSSRLSVWLRPSYRQLILYFILAALFNLTPSLFPLVYGDLDPSFNYAFNQAASLKLHFGSQFISTYGPLGYLVSNYLPGNVYKVSFIMLVYVLLLAVGVYIFINYYVKGSLKNKLIISALMLYVLSVTTGGDGISTNFLSLFLLYCFIYLKTRGRRQLGLGLCLGAAAGAFFLIKFTIGAASLAAIVALPIFNISEGIKQRLQNLTAMFLAFLVFALGLGSYLGINNFPAYVKTNLLLSSGFSNAMPISGNSVATWLIGISLVLLIVWVATLEKINALKYIFILPTIYITWKYSVVRQDDHLLLAIQIIWPLTLIIWFLKPRVKGKNLFIPVLIVVLSVLSVWANGIAFSGVNESFSAVAFSPLENIKSLGPINFIRIHKQKAEWSKYSALGLQGAALPVSMKQMIGRDGVDVFPWETDIVAANNLTWQPRPSPFSFESYNPYFDNLNANYFNSSRAPKFIIWHNTGVKSVDYRYLLWDEPKTLRTILQNYNLTSKSKGFMLLKKKQTIAKPNIKQLGSVVTQWGDMVTIPKHSTGSEIFADISVKRDEYSKVTTFLLRSDTFSIYLKQANSSYINYQYVLENGPQGLLINNLPLNWNQLTELARNKYFDLNYATKFKLVQTSSRTPTHSPVTVEFFEQDFNQ